MKQFQLALDMEDEAPQEIVESFRARGDGTVLLFDLKAGVPAVH